MTIRKSWQPWFANSVAKQHLAEKSVAIFSPQARKFWIDQNQSLKLSLQQMGVMGE